MTPPPTAAPPMRRDPRFLVMAASLATAVLMLIGKLTAYAMTGSTAILSDAIESVVHILATSLAAFSLWWSHQEACERHPYGHGKIAYFSAGFEGAIIVVAALLIFYTAAQDLISGKPPGRLGVGIAITGGLAVVNLVLGTALVRVGRRRNALILVANGRHVLTDMWTSLGVVVGIALVWATGLPWIDPLVAALVGCNILWEAAALIRKSVRGLLDAVEPEYTDLLLACLDRFAADGRIEGFHQLRHRRANDAMWVEVHLLMPGRMHVSHAHAVATDIENAIQAIFPAYQVYITSHIEPATHDRAHPDGHAGLHDPYDEPTE